MRQPGMTEEVAEELFRQVAAFASFGFAKSHAAAFARTAYESSFLKLFYPAQFLVGLINAQPMGFYPVEVLVNDTKRHGVAVLPVDINASSYKTTTEWVGPAGRAAAGRGRGSTARPEPVRSPACVVPSAAARERWTPEVTAGWGVRLGLAPRQGDRRAARGAAGRGAGARAVPRAWPTSSSGPGCPRRSSSGSSGPGRWIRWGGRGASCCGSSARWPARHAAGWTGGRCAGSAGRPASAGRRPGGRWTCACPATEAPALPAITESERIGDAYAVIGLDARRQVVALFRPALDRLGAVTNAALSPSGARAGSGSAGWSSPASTR